MTVDSYRNFRLRSKYIGAARMLELQEIIWYSFIPNLQNWLHAAVAVLLLTGSEMSTLAG